MMNNYITGKIIKELREKRQLTQMELANKMNVSDKTVSKWETGKGLPDITLIEPLAKTLNVSIIELMNGEYITNQNESSNMYKSNFSVCPICGNIIHTMGENINSCCGILLPILEAEDENEKHSINCDMIENELFISMNHEMSKQHYISFIAAVSDQSVQFTKLYPEQAAEARFKRARVKYIYAYCNHHGLYLWKAK